jgi:hypothetical protein
LYLRKVILGEQLLHVVDGVDSPVMDRKLPTGTFWLGFGVFIRRYADDDNVKTDATSIIVAIGNTASIKAIF